MDNNLENLRKNIDAIDTAVVCLFAARFRITEQVGWHKKENHLPIVDQERELRQLGAIAAFAESQGLNPKFAQQILRMTIDEVISRHEEIMRSSNQPVLTGEEGNI